MFRPILKTEKIYSYNCLNNEDSYMWLSHGVCHHPKIHYEWAVSGAQGHQYPNAVPRRWITESSRIKMI